MTLPAPKPFFIPAVSIAVIPGITLNNLDGSGLRIEWSILRDNTNKPDEGEITIYGLNEATIGVLDAQWKITNALRPFSSPTEFTFSLGWDLVPQIVLQGAIISFVSNFRTATDVLTTWRIGDTTVAQRDAVVGRDFHNVKISIVLDYLINLPPAPDDAGGGGLGLIFLPESKALIAQAATTLGTFQEWGNITKGMNVADAISAIMETLGLEWRVHNGAFVAMRGGIINKPGPVIAPQNGLISYTPMDDGGILFEGLADAKFEPGIRCGVLDNLGKPVGAPSYRVESVSLFGSTDEDSLMEVVARKPTALTLGPLLSIPTPSF